MLVCSARTRMQSLAPLALPGPGERHGAPASASATYKLNSKWTILHRIIHNTPTHLKFGAQGCHEVFEHGGCGGGLASGPQHHGPVESQLRPGRPLALELEDPIRGCMRVQLQNVPFPSVHVCRGGDRGSYDAVPQARSAPYRLARPTRRGPAPAVFARERIKVFTCTRGPKRRRYMA